MKKILILGFILLILVSCAKTPTDNENENNDNNPQFIVPLAVGNYWHYNVSATFITCNGDDLECEFDDSISEAENTITGFYNQGKSTTQLFVNESDTGIRYIDSNIEEGFFQYGRLNSSDELLSDEKLESVFSFL